MEVELSSYKRGYGLYELLADGRNNYWSTDGQLPHALRITFARLTYVHAVELGLNYASDDSYTPEFITLYADGFAKDYHFPEPSGVVSIPLLRNTFEIVLTITANHSEGKDSHVRSLRVFTDESTSMPVYINVERQTN
ncbi:anaphase-promoting complex subunit 10 [Pancytospora philotis]|nr:anaphase-promoting complex subunit 10 [Pancytospora philotis]